MRNQMSSNGSPADGALGSFEYEFTDELGFAAALAVFERTTGRVKADIVRRGVPHPALPLAGASVMLAVALVVAAVMAWDWWPTQILMVLGSITLLVLLFKTGLYFCPPFAHWFIRRRVRSTTRRLGTRNIRWTLFEDRLETKSAAVERSLQWADFTELEKVGDFWLLRWRGGLELVTPANLMPADVRAVIERKAPRSFDGTTA